MKKILLVLTLVALMAAVVACSKETKEETKNDAVEAIEEAKTTEEAKAIEMPENLGTVNSLAQYKDLEVKLGDKTVTDEEVMEEINTALESSTELKEVDRPAQDGDTLNIDYEGKLDGVAFDGGTAQGANLVLGSNMFIDGFEDGLIGAKKGETRVLDLTFPENYQSTDLAGKQTEFTVTVNSVNEKIVPELTDEWVEKYTNGEVKTVDEYKKEVRDELEDYRELDVESAAQNELVSKVIEESDVTVTDEAIDYFYALQMQYFDTVVTAYGMTLDEYIEALGQDKATFEEQLRVSAEEMAKQRLINDAIMEAEGLTLEDDDYEDLAKAYGYDVESLKSLYGAEIFENSVRSYKVGKYILENAKKQ